MLYPSYIELWGANLICWYCLGLLVIHRASFSKRKKKNFRAETHSCLTVNEGYVVMYACIQQVRLNLWGMHIHVVPRAFSAMHALFRQHVG